MIEFGFKALGLIFGGAVLYALVRLLLAWPIMLLVDPATQGAYTFSYVQALAVSVLVGLLVPGQTSYKRD